VGRPTVATTQSTTASAAIVTDVSRTPIIKRVAERTATRQLAVSRRVATRKLILDRREADP
jgi:hypothetical protein